MSPIRLPGDAQVGRAMGWVGGARWEGEGGRNRTAAEVSVEHSCVWMWGVAKEWRGGGGAVCKRDKATDHANRGMRNEARSSGPATGVCAVLLRVSDHLSRPSLQTTSQGSR